ncbi:hypothetical protein LCGC14_1145180 [marine sediment metagenome]|uniref:Uncharacterized protein n=1 Tax=marine sediment metagenome TaxID=412755 RepID=A0A0F9Q2R8_9ZZZZ
MLYKIKIVGMGCVYLERLETSGRSFNSDYYIETRIMSNIQIIQDAFVIQLICPVCSDGCITQEMIQYRDFPEWMFCPHCDLVILTPVPVDIYKEGELAYMGHQAKEFIKRWKDEHN